MMKTVIPARCLQIFSIELKPGSVMEMYRSEKVSKHITRIIDIAGVACYLIEGNDDACLLDTCCGYGDLKAYVQTLTDKEPFVILTHGHYDHTGSASLFETVYMSHLDLPVLEEHNRKRSFFLEEDRKVIPSLKNITMADLNPLMRETPMPLADGDCFDLGGIHLQMISVPGHTQGMMCALLKEEKTIFLGDACGTGVFLHEPFSSTASEYEKSLRRLKTFEDQYEHIYRNHGSFISDKDILDNVLECASLIAQRRDDHHPVTMYGKTLFEAKRRVSGKRPDGKEGNIVYAAEKAG